MALRLSLIAPTTIPIELDGIVPDQLRDKSAHDIARWPIFHGNEQIPLAELFHVTGSAADERIVFAGDNCGVHRIGARMQSGTIYVEASAGRHVGSQMTGGEIVVAGDADDWAGGEMHGGLIRIQGRAGHHLGAAYRGSERGMDGGTILVHGDAGDEVAHTMRRGLIAVGGSVGDFPAINMLAGSLFVYGRCGIRPAAGMRRGTLAFFADQPQLLPTFRAGGPCQPLFMRVYLRRLAELGYADSPELADATYEIHHGDLLNGGRGEVLVRR